MCPVHKALYFLNSGPADRFLHNFQILLVKHVTSVYSVTALPLTIQHIWRIADCSCRGVYIENA